MAKRMNRAGIASSCDYGIQIDAARRRRRENTRIVYPNSIAQTKQCTETGLRKVQQRISVETVCIADGEVPLGESDLSNVKPLDTRGWTRGERYESHC